MSKLDRQESCYHQCGDRRMLPEFRRTVTGDLFARYRDGSLYKIEERKVRRLNKETGKHQEVLRPIFHKFHIDIRDAQP